MSFHPIRKEYFLPMLAAIAAYGVYSNMLNAGLAWDDHYYINRFPLRFNSFSSLFLPTDLKGAIMVFYRPFIGLTYVFDYSIWFDKPSGYHLTNILLHVANTLVLYMITRKLFTSASLAFWTALLFAVHPIHTESVSWISGRTDVLAAMFALLAMYSHMEFCEGKDKRALIPAILFFGLALFSKEIAIGMVITFVLYDLKISGQKKLRPFSYIVYGIVGLIYLAMRQAYLSTTNVELSFKPLPEMLVTFFSSIAFYAYKLSYPFEQNLYISEIPHQVIFFTIGLILSLGVLVLFKKKQWGYIFLTVSFLATIAPSIVGAFTTVLSPPFAERYLYLPSAFLCMGIAYAASTLNKNRGYYFLIPIVLVFAFTTYTRNELWKSEALLWKDTVEKTSHWYPKSEYARVLLSEKKLDESLAMSEASLSQATHGEVQARSLSKIYNNLGQIYLGKGDTATAIVYFNKAIESSRTNPIPYHNLGELFLAKAEKDRNSKDSSLKQAEGNFIMALENDPYLFESYLSLGEVFYMYGDFKKAETYFMKVITLAPNTSYSADAVKSLLRPEILKAK